MTRAGRVPPSLPKLLGKSFVTAGVLTVTLAGLVLALIALNWRREATVPAVWVAVLGTVAAVAVATSVHAAATAHSAAMKRLPGVRVVKPPPPSYRGVKCVLLLEPSDLFVTDAAVSVYVLEEEDYEAIFGIGRVMAIQDNELIQVAVTAVAPEQQSMLQRVIANDKTALRLIIVKPHLATSMREYFGDES